MESFYDSAGFKMNLLVLLAFIMPEAIPNHNLIQRLFLGPLVSSALWIPRLRVPGNSGYEKNI